MSLVMLFSKCESCPDPQTFDVLGSGLGHAMPGSVFLVFVWTR